VPRLGQLLDALGESDAFVQLEPSNCGSKPVSSFRQSLENSIDARFLLLQR
jgi:hypothetical protein